MNSYEKVTVAILGIQSLVFFCQLVVMFRQTRILKGQSTIIANQEEVILHSKKHSLYDAITQFLDVAASDTSAITNYVDISFYREFIEKIKDYKCLNKKVHPFIEEIITKGNQLAFLEEKIKKKHEEPSSLWDSDDGILVNMDKVYAEKQKIKPEYVKWFKNALLDNENLLKSILFD